MSENKNKIILTINETPDDVSAVYGDYIFKDDYYAEKIAIFGNPYFNSYKKASWLETAESMIDDMEYYEKSDFINFYKDNFSVEILKKVYTFFENSKTNPDNIDFIFVFLKLLYPDKKFSYGNLRGYCQSDWNEYILCNGEDLDIHEISDFYFGNVTEVKIEKFDENGELLDLYYDYIADSVFWNMERKDLKTQLSMWITEPMKNVTVRKITGYKQVPVYEEI